MIISRSNNNNDILQRSSKSYIGMDAENLPRKTSIDIDIQNVQSFEYDINDVIENVGRNSRQQQYSNSYIENQRNDSITNNQKIQIVNYQLNKDQDMSVVLPNIRNQLIQYQNNKTIKIAMKNKKIIPVKCNIISDSELISRDQMLQNYQNINLSNINDSKDTANDQINWFENFTLAASHPRDIQQDKSSYDHTPIGYQNIENLQQRNFSQDQKTISKKSSQILAVSANQTQGNFYKHIPNNQMSGKKYKIKANKVNISNMQMTNMLTKNTLENVRNPVQTNQLVILNKNKTISQDNEMSEFAYNTQDVQPQLQLQGQQLSQNISVALRKYSQVEDSYRYQQNNSNFQTSTELQRKEQQYIIQNQASLIEQKLNNAQRTAQKPHLKDIFEHQNDQIRMIMSRHRAVQPNPYRPFYNNQPSQSNIIQHKESSSNPSALQSFNQPNETSSLPPNHRHRNQTVLDNIHEINKSSLAKISFHDSSDFRRGNQSFQQHSSKQQRRGSSIFVTSSDDKKLINSQVTYEVSYDQTNQKKGSKVSKNLSTITKFPNQIKQKQRMQERKVSSTLINYALNSEDLLQTKQIEKKVTSEILNLENIKPSGVQQNSDDELKLSHQGSSLHSQSISKNNRFEQDRFLQDGDSKFQKRNRSMLGQQKQISFSPFQDKKNNRKLEYIQQELEDNKTNNSRLIQNLKKSQNHLGKVIQNYSPKIQRMGTDSSKSNKSPMEKYDDQSLPPIERRFSNNLKELQFQVLNTSKFKKITGFDNDQINPNYYTTSQRDKDDQQFINSPKFSSRRTKDFNFNSFSPQSDNNIGQSFQKNEIYSIEKQKHFMLKTEDQSSRLPYGQIYKNQKFIGPLANRDLKQFITPQSNEIQNYDFSANQDQSRFQNNQSTILVHKDQRTAQISISPMKVVERVMQFRKAYGNPTGQITQSPSIVNSEDKSREVLSQNSDRQIVNSDQAQDSPNKYNRYNPSIMIIESQDKSAEQQQGPGAQEQGDSFYSLGKKKVKDNKYKNSKFVPKSIEKFQVKNFSNNYSPVLDGFKRKQFEEENEQTYIQTSPQIKEGHYQKVKKTDQFYELKILKTHTYQGEQAKYQLIKNQPKQNRQNLRVMIPKNTSANFIIPLIDDSQKSPDMANKSMITNQTYTTPSPMKEYEGNKEPKLQLKDFEVLNKIGQGNFSTVFKAICKTTDLEVALKIVKKESVGLMKQVDHILNERAILKYFQIINEESNICPFIVKFIGSFYTEDNLYFQLEYLDGGNLLTYIRNRNRKIADNVQFYAAEVIMALEFMHKQGVVYRDLKPENIVLSIKNNGHIKIVDFGFAKFLREPTNLQNLPYNENALFNELKRTWANLQSKNERTNTSCGTPVYMAPEICQGVPYSYQVDIWSLGVLIVEIVSGKLPFTGDSPKEIQENILKCQPTYSSSVGHQLRDLCRKIFVPDSDNRIRFSEIKKHPFFQRITTWNYRDFYKKEKAPFIPDVQEFDEQLQRNIENGELQAAGQGLMAILQAPVKNHQANMSFDSDHFNKFLREHEQPKDNNDLSEEKPSAKKRKRHNILGDFKLKKIEMFF